jgi:hypothetical protein
MYLRYIGTTLFVEKISNYMRTESALALQIFCARVLLIV